jgi:hypothetical protein
MKIITPSLCSVSHRTLLFSSVRHRARLFFLLLSLLLGFQSFALHPLKLSVVDITHVDKKLKIKFKLFVEDMDAVMGQYTKKPFTLVKFANKDIDAITQKQIANYMAGKFSMEINKVPLKFIFKKAYLDQAKLFTDYAVVYVELETKWSHSTEIKTIAMTNSVMFEVVPEQKNMANIHIGKIDHIFQFENEANIVTQKVDF